MEVVEAIERRRTVRDFQEKPVDPEIIRKIIEAGLHAPSNDHLRQWEFIVVNNPPVRRALISKVNKNLTAGDSARLLDKWGFTDPTQREMYIDGIPKQYRMLLTAGCLIIPCFRQETPLLKPKNLSALNGFASIWCCIENMLLAAAAEGIYGVTRIPFDREIKHIKATLGIPPKYGIPCYLAFGYPVKEIKPVLQKPVRTEERIHYDKW